jgi:hypothetical protein
MGYPVFMLNQVTDADDNDWLDFNYNGTVYHVQIPETTYTDIRYTLAALQVAMRDATSTTDIYCELLTTGHARIRTTSAVTFELHWKTGTHGSDGLDDHCGTVLGFLDTANDTGAITYTSDYQVQTIWMAPEYDALDTYDRPRRMGAPTFVAVNGASYRCTWSTHYPRRMRFGFVPVAQFLTAKEGTSVNQAFQRFWEEAIDGTPFQLFADGDSIGVGDDEGTYCLVANENEDMAEGYDRMGPGMEYYPVELRMQLQP